MFHKVVGLVYSMVMFSLGFIGKIEAYDFYRLYNNI